MSKLFIAIVVVVLIIIIALIWAYATPRKGSEVYQKTSPPTPSAIVHIETLKEGSGSAMAQSGDIVTVNYVGRLTDGTKFDSSIDRGQPFTFTLGSGRVIEGWDQGIVGMKVGEERQLTIPPSLAYGDKGTPGGPIPPDATLIFDVTMVKIGQ